MDQFWSNKILVLLCEGPKPHNSMISEFVTPWGPLFIDFNIPKCFNEYKTIMETFSTFYFDTYQNLQNRNCRTFETDLEKTGTEKC